jgi:5-methylcytosine-specific restriction endonuclease McrA
MPAGAGCVVTQHPEERRLTRLAISYNKKAARLGVSGIVTAVDLARKPQRCRYCGIGLEVGQGTFDHITPFDRGGTNQPENIDRCCLTCNRTKFNKTPAEFEAHQELRVTCPVCTKVFKPRWGEYINGRARLCSRSCSAKWRWQ